MKTSFLHSITALCSILLLSLSFVACNDFNFETIKGNGNVIMESKYIQPDYDEVSVAGSFDVTIVPAKQDSVIIAAESNIIPYIIIEKRGELLVIKNTPNTNLRTTKPVKITLFSANISSIDLSGSGNINADSLNSADINLSISGSGSILAGVVSENLQISIAGSGDVMVNGTTTNSKNHIAGSGNIKSYGLVQQNCKASIAGSGDIFTFPEKSLNASIAGSGSVYYKGNPSISVDISGSGKVLPAK